MVNPVEPAANFFLGFFSVLPTPLKLLCFASFGFFAISIIVN